MRGRMGRSLARRLIARFAAGVCLALLAVSLAAAAVAGEQPAPPPATEPDPTTLDDVALLTAARAAYQAGDYARAVQLFEVWCRRAPAAGARWYELGRAQYHIGLYRAAAESFQRARAGGFVSEHLELWAGFAAFKLNDWTATAECLERVPAAEMQPEVRLKRAIAWFNLEDSRAAIEFERLAVEDSPVGYAAQYYRALCYENADRPGQAYDQYEALRARPAPYGPAARLRLQAIQAPAYLARGTYSAGYDSRPARANDDSNVAGAEADGFQQIDFNLAVRPLYGLERISPVIYWLALAGYHHAFFRNHDLDDSSLGLTQSVENSPERFFNFRVDQAVRRHWLGGNPYFDELELTGALQWRARNPGQTHLGGVSLDADWTHSVGDSYRPFQGLSGSLFGSYGWIYTPAPDWTLTLPVYCGGRLRQAHDVGENYRQVSLQVGPSLLWRPGLLLATSFSLDDRYYRSDPAVGGGHRHEWPVTLAISLETPLWAHSSVQINGQWVEQQANRSAFRFSDRQFWISLYCWY